VKSAPASEGDGGEIVQSCDQCLGLGRVDTNGKKRSVEGRVGTSGGKETKQLRHLFQRKLEPDLSKTEGEEGSRGQSLKDGCTKKRNKHVHNCSRARGRQGSTKGALRVKNFLKKRRHVKRKTKATAGIQAGFYLIEKGGEKATRRSASF